MRKKICFSSFTLVLSFSFSFSLFSSLYALENIPEIRKQRLSLTADDGAATTTSGFHCAAASTEDEEEDDDEKNVKKSSNTLSTMPRQLEKRADDEWGVRWTAEEEKELVRLREGEGKSWKEIATNFPERTWRSVCGKYYALKGPEPVPVSEGRRRRTKKNKHWTDAENERLFRLKEQPAGERRLTWDEIAEQFPGREKKAITTHYHSLKKDFEDAPAKVNEEKYTDDEKALILKVAKMDIPWKRKMKYFPGRKMESVKNMYHRLKPEEDKTGIREPWTTWTAWTPEEEDRLVEALKEGKSVREISPLLGRSIHAIQLRVILLKESGRILPGQYGTRLPPYTTADFELMREKREEGMSWNNIARQYFPDRSVNSPRDRYRAYLNKLKGEGREGS